MKKSLIFFFSILILTSLVTAESVDIEFPNGNSFEAGESITFKVVAYDAQGKPIDGTIKITIEDAERKARTEKTALSKEVINIDLGEKASSGQGIITAEYQNAEAIAFFEIGRKELARFELEENTLKVTNIGNTKYSKVIKITIGETTGTKEPTLDIGESVTYRLIAPEGTYGIRITDGKTTLTRGEVRLTGTGNVVGAIDESASQRSPLTGVASPDEDSDEALLSYVKNNSFVYIFMIAIFAAMILLGIERRYKKKAK